MSRALDDFALLVVSHCPGSGVRFGSAVGASARIHVWSDAVSVAARSTVTCTHIATQGCCTRGGGVRDEEANSSGASETGETLTESTLALQTR